MPSSHPKQLEEPQADTQLQAQQLWQQVGQAFCITLSTRSDRKDHAQLQFARVGLGNLITFHEAVPHPHNSEQGIYESHVACLNKGLASAQNTNTGRPIIVFEDDIFFDRFYVDKLKQVCDFMHENKNEWDVLFLGGFVKASRSTRWPGVRKIRYQCTAHAYVMSPAFAQRIAQQPFDGKAYDDVLRDLPAARYFALYPAIGFQSDSPSDNHKTPVIDRVRRLLGGMARLQRFNELVHRHMTLLIVGHVVVLGLFMVLAIMLWQK